MKYKVFLNNPNRKWEDTNIVWLCLGDKYSMPYNKTIALTWPNVHQYMYLKYGLLYHEKEAVNLPLNLGLTEDPLANKTGNQVVASGNEEVQQQVV